MEKLFAALFFLIPLPVFGEVDFEGFFRSRAVVTVDSRKLSDTETNFSHSLRLQGALYPSQNLQTHFWLLSSKQWGEDISISDSFRVYAYGNWNITDELELILGQVPYETDPSFISQNLYEPFPYMFEGIFLHYSANSFSCHVWGAYPPKRRVGLKEEKGSKYSLGAALDVDVAPEFFKKIHLHLIYLMDSFKGLSETKGNSRYGLSLQGEIGGKNLDYAVSFGGLNFKSDQTMLDIEAGYSFPNWFDSRAFFGFHRDTQDYNGWLYDRHDKGGFLDLLQWGNLTYALVGLSFSFPKDFDMTVQFLRFQKTEKGSFYRGRYGDLFLKEDPLKTHSKSLGNELDLQLIKNFGTAFQTRALAGIFIPEKGALSLLKDQNIFSQFQLTALYKF